MVLALGTRLGPFGTLPQYGLDYWPRGAKIIQVDLDPRVLGLVKPIALGINGDARAAAAAITEELRILQGAAPPQPARLARITAERETWAAALAALAGANEPARIDPRRALTQLARALPDNAMVATDIGNVCSVANSYLRFERPNSFFAAMSFGNCGYAFPTAMGAKVGRPERPAIAYVGDGAWGMSLAEVMTCVRESIPVVAVVFDNGQWGAEKRNQIDYFDRRFLGTELRNPDFAEVARAMGAHGLTVEHEDQIGDALREAIGSNRPTVINLRLTQTLADPFRRDAFQPPQRLLAKYAAHSAKT